MMGYGYENAAGDRISALIDMINGGGPGRSGDTFEGGGILSLLANAVAKPYGSVRERPGHTPMGATAAPVDVLRPVATDAGVGAVDTSGLPAAEERPVLPGLAEEGYRGAIFRPTFSPAATGGRRFMEEDLALLPSLHPDVRVLFSEVKLGEVLPAPLAMFLDVARVGSAAPAAGTRSISEPSTPVTPVAGPMQGPPAPVTPVAGPMQGPPAPVTTAYDYLGDSTFFTPDQLDAMSPQMRAMAEEHNRENLMLASEVFRVPAAPIVSPRPEPRPEPRNAGAAGAVPVAAAPPTDATAAPTVSPRPPARPAADTASAAGAVTSENQPVRKVISGVTYDFFRNGVVFRPARNLFSVPVGEEYYYLDPRDGRVFKEGLLGTFGDEVTQGSRLYNEVMKLVDQVR